MEFVIWGSGLKACVGFSVQLFLKVSSGREWRTGAENES